MVWVNSIKKLLLHWGLIAPANKASWQNGWKLNPRHEVSTNDVRFTPLKSRDHILSFSTLFWVHPSGNDFIKLLPKTKAKSTLFVLL